MIGAEGSLVIGGFAAAAVAIPLVAAGLPAVLILALMASAAMIVGGLWTGLAGWLRHARGVNETISTLLLTYIAIAIMSFFVEGALRDPGSANRPSTPSIGQGNMIGDIPGTSVHWGLVVGILLAGALWVLMSRTTFGFAARLTGGNPRAALAQGLPVGRLIVACAMIGGAPAPGSRGSSRSQPCTGRRTPRWWRATASPASSSPSSPGRIRSPSCRWRSCSARSPPRAG